jgi:hypothetical protein
MQSNDNENPEKTDRILIAQSWGEVTGNDPLTLVMSENEWKLHLTIVAHLRAHQPVPLDDAAELRHTAMDIRTFLRLAATNFTHKRDRTVIAKLDVLAAMYAMGEDIVAPNRAEA